MSDMGSVKEYFEYGVLLASIIGGLIVGWLRLHKPIKDWLGSIFGDNTKAKPKKRMPQVEDNKIIHEVLNKLRYESDACRVKILQYHNGGSFATGKSMKKMSLTHESCHPAMIPVGTTDVMLSLFNDLLEIAHLNTPELINTSSIKESYFKSYLQSNHVLMFSVLPIRNLKGEEIGILMSQWCAWSFADAVHADRFSQEFTDARNIIEYYMNKK